MNADRFYDIEIHFATSAYPRVIARKYDEVEALRFARGYLGADAFGVRVLYPDGTAFNLKTNEREAK